MLHVYSQKLSLQITKFRTNRIILTYQLEMTDYSAKMTSNTLSQNQKDVEENRKLPIERMEEPTQPMISSRVIKEGLKLKMSV